MSRQQQIVLGIIGGSGLHTLDALQHARTFSATTPFGEPSSEIMEGTLHGVRILFLARHGVGHRLAPHRINYRANIFALKQLGAQLLLSVSAVGSLRETIQPGDMLVVDQYIDRTRQRPNTFFDEPGLVAHVSLQEPVDAALSRALA